MKISSIIYLASFVSENKKEPVAECNRLIGLIGYLSVYKKVFFTGIISSPINNAFPYALSSFFFNIFPFLSINILDLAVPFSSFISYAVLFLSTSSSMDVIL